LHSRNAAEHSEEHGDKHPNPYAVQEANIGGLVQLVGSGSVTFDNCTMNGVPVSGVFSLRSGGLSVSRFNQIPIFYQPTQIKLDKVVDQNGKEFVFPFDLVEGNQLPEVFAAKYALNWLNSCVSQL